MGQIYILENKINGKKYVGQTNKKAERRIASHIKLANSGKGFVINRAIAKYGINNFNIEIITVKNKRLDFFEKLFIKNLNTMVPHGYNLESGGKRNKYLPEETKRKIGEASRGHKHSELTKKILSERKIGKNNPMYGKKHSTKVKKKMSSSQKERWNDDLRKHYSEMFSGPNSPSYGKKHSKETIDKIRKRCSGKNSVHYGKHRTKEVRKKISKAHKGKILSEETKRKISEANKGHKAWNKGKKWNEKTRKKISEKATKYKTWDVWVNSKDKILYKTRDGKRKRVNFNNIPSEIKEKVNKLLITIY